MSIIIVNNKMDFEFKPNKSESKKNVIEIIIIIITLPTLLFFQKKHEMRYKIRVCMELEANFNF